MEEKCINNKINKLPNEIFLKILYNINDLSDLINIYDYFKKYRKLISYEINTYFKNTDSKNDEHYLFILLKDIRHFLDGYITKDENTIKNKMINNIEKLYNSHYIYKIIINHYLMCEKCTYIINIYNYRHIYKCFICDKKICKNCNIKCHPCAPYNTKPFYHCKNCKEDYFYYINEKLNKFNVVDKEIMKQIKYIFYKLYENCIIDKNNKDNQEDIKKLLLLQYFIKIKYIT